MAWDIEYTNEFGNWWDIISEKEQNDIVAVVNLLAEKGANLPFPYSQALLLQNTPKCENYEFRVAGNL